MCPAVLPQEVPSREVRSDPVMTSSVKSPDLNSEHCGTNSVGDALESSDGIHTLKSVSQPVTVHSSLDAIAAVCNEVRAMDLQTDSTHTSRTQNQISVLRAPRIWVPTPKTGVPAHTTTSVRGSPSPIDRDD